MKQRKSLVAFGKLTFASGQLEDVRCEIFYGTSTEEQMTADLYSFGAEVDMMTVMRLMHSGRIEFLSEGDNQRISWTGFFGGTIINGTSDCFARANITELTVADRRSADQPDKYAFYFRLTQSEIFRRKMPKTHDSRFGLLFGWHPFEERFEEEALTFDINEWKATIKPSLDLSEINSKSHNVTEYLLCELKVESGDLAARAVEARNVIQSVLDVLSVWECTSVEWQSFDLVASSGDTRIVEAEVYAQRYFRKYDVDPFIVSNASLYQAALSIASSQWLGLDQETRKKVEAIVEPLLASNQVDLPMDMRIVRLHTAMETIVKQQEIRDARGFSVRWILTLEALGLDWQSLYPDVVRESVFDREQGNKFKLTDWRNSILHDGNLPERIQYFDLLKEVRRGQYVVRKVIAKIVGYQDPVISERPAPSMTITNVSGETLTFGG
jgi:hypothetical protein